MKNAVSAFLPLVGLTCIWASCARTQPARRHVAAQVTWQEGDVVFRRGTGAVGQAVVVLDGGGPYSHVGIVAFYEGTPMVVHAVPGEPDFDGDPDRVKLDSIDVFYANDRASRGIVMRHADSAAAARAAKVAYQAYERRALFDHGYDDRDTSRLYCTELITFAFDRAGAPLPVNQHEVNLPGVAGAVTFPSDLAACPQLHPIYSF